MHVRNGCFRISHVRERGEFLESGSGYLSDGTPYTLSWRNRNATSCEKTLLNEAATVHPLQPRILYIACAGFYPKELGSHALKTRV